MNTKGYDTALSDIGDNNDFEIWWDRGTENQCRKNFISNINLLVLFVCLLFK